MYLEEKIEEFQVQLDDISRLEDIKKCNIPNDYKDFLLNYNGGRPEFDTFETKEDFPFREHSFSDIQYFFGMTDNGDGYDILKKMRVLNNRIPQELLPIACDSCGNVICLGIKGETYGKVFFWDHENEIDEDGKEPWWENITLIADSFTDLINNLCKYDLDEKDRAILTYQDGTTRVIE